MEATTFARTVPFSRFAFIALAGLALGGCTVVDVASSAGDGDERIDRPDLPAGSTDAVLQRPTPAGWQAASAQGLDCGRHTSTADGAGHVLVVGECMLDGVSAPALLYDHDARHFTPVALLEPRTYHSALLLSDGRVALVGDAAHVEYFSFATGSSELGPALLTPRTEPTLASIPAWPVGFRIIGGFDAMGSPLDSEELVLPGQPQMFGGQLMAGRARAIAVPGDSVQAWIAGGISSLAGGSVALPTSSEFSFCPHAAFTPSADLGEAPGDLAAVQIGKTALVISTSWTASWDGTTLSPHVAHTPVFMPAAAVTSTGRVVVAGIKGPYENELVVLETSATMASHVVGTRDDGGAMTTVSSVGGNTVLVISRSADLVTLP